MIDFIRILIISFPILEFLNREKSRSNIILFENREFPAKYSSVDEKTIQYRIFSSIHENNSFFFIYSNMDDKIQSLEKYNFWKGEVRQTGTNREFYTKNILHYTGNKLIKVLTGQRRAGKSYILRQMIQKLMEIGVPPQNILYINREFIEFDFLKNYHHLNDLFETYKNHKKPEGKIYLFIDEIQDINGWERFVNSMSQDYSEEYELFITGSNSRMLSGELATLLSGRYVHFEVLPFDYKEYLKINNVLPGKESFLKYMASGGLPELFHLPNDETKRNYVSSLADTIILRDIIQRYSVKESRLLQDVFVYLINNASNLVSITNILNYFKSRNRKTSYDTIANYIGYLEDAFLIHKAERYNIKGKDILSGTAKYYVNDLAFKNYLYPGFAYGLGYQLENLIYLTLRKYGYTVYVGNLGENEIDFVAQKDGNTLYVQSSYSLSDEKTAIREYKALKAIQDNYPKIVVSLDDIKLPDNEGIHHIQAWNFQEFLRIKSKI